jgi:hypothetical protein
VGCNSFYLLVIGSLNLWFLVLLCCKFFILKIPGVYTLIEVFLENFLDSGFIYMKIKSEMFRDCKTC